MSSEAERLAESRSTLGCQADGISLAMTIAPHLFYFGKLFLLRVSSSYDVLTHTAFILSHTY